MSALDPSTYEAISIECRANGVVVATLNRPDQRNAIDAAMHTEMTRLPLEFDDDPDTRVLVITAAGRDFSVGLDVGNRPDPKAAMSWVREGRLVIDRILDCEKPIISIVHGYAMGFAATYALLADVVFAARDAVFCDPHVKNGVGAGDGGQLIWPLLVGVSRAKYFLMTGAKVTAEEADRLGLVTFVDDEEALRAAAFELADGWAAGPAEAIKASKAGITAYLKALNAIIQPVAMRAEALTLHSADRVEAITAFRERRPPNFTGE